MHGLMREGRHVPALYSTWGSPRFQSRIVYSCTALRREELAMLPVRDDQIDSTRTLIALDAQP